MSLPHLVNNEIKRKCIHCRRFLMLELYAPSNSLEYRYQRAPTYGTHLTMHADIHWYLSAQPPD